MVCFLLALGCLKNNGQLSNIPPSSQYNTQSGEINPEQLMKGQSNEYLTNDDTYNPRQQ